MCVCACVSALNRDRHALSAGFCQRERERDRDRGIDRERETAAPHSVECSGSASI